MATSLTWVGLRLDPLDTLFFRDGRGFGAANRAGGGLPNPQTVAGAIRTALLAHTGFDFARFTAHRRQHPHSLRESLQHGGAKDWIPDTVFRGPWLALAEGPGGSASPLLPMPEVLRRARAGGWSVAKPVSSVPGWSNPHGLHALWREREADPKADAELLTVAGLKAFLNNSTPANDQCVKRDELTAADHRIGIELDKDTLASADGMLYAISLIATKPKHNGMPVCLYVEIKLPPEFTNLLDDILVPFGGEGKYVRARRCPGSVFDDSLAEPVRSGPTLWYLATPTFFAPNASPLPKTGGKLIAAASGAGVPVSGWDVARNGPRPTRFAIPAGAVYFVDGHADPNDFLNTGHETESKDLRQEGWGFALPGSWEGLK